MRVKALVNVLFLAGLMGLVVWAMMGERPIAAAGEIVYVDADATGAGNGSSWADAYPELQSALAAAAPGSEIWVAEGVYYPDYDPETGTHTGIVTASFVLTDGVRLYGGFAGTETVRSARDWEAHPTVLSGDIDRNDLVDARGVVTSWEQITGTNACIIMDVSDTDAMTVLDGFFVTAAQRKKDDASPCKRWFSGVYNERGTPIIENLTFIGNFAELGLTGMLNISTTIRISDVSFIGNSEYSLAGLQSNIYLNEVVFKSNKVGMVSYESTKTLKNVAFESNTLGVDCMSSISVYDNVIFKNNQSGISSWDSRNELRNVIFDGNHRTLGHGGAAMFSLKSDNTLLNVVFVNNHSVGTGGAMMDFSDDTRSSLKNVVFRGNTASSHGGGFYSEGSATLENVTFLDNEALGQSARGGGLYAAGATITRATFVGNRARGLGGGAFIENADVRDVIFAGNVVSGSDGIGGGLRIYFGRLVNVVFSGNVASSSGGGMSSHGDTSLANITFANNTAYERGGGFFNGVNAVHGEPTLANAILWGNTAPEGAQIFNGDWSTMTIAYSNIQGSGGSGTGWDAALGVDGGGNLDADPRFVDALGADGVVGTLDDDLRLAPDSPCVDAGDSAAVPAGVLTDLDGFSRFYDWPGTPDTGTGLIPIVDMGAYELQVIYRSYLPVVARTLPSTIVLPRRGR